MSSNDQIFGTDSSRRNILQTTSSSKPFQEKLSVPKVIIVTGYGINCEEETSKAFELSGGLTTIVHINDLIGNPKMLNDYQIMAFPGGFSYADDTGSGNALANKIKNNIEKEILDFAKQDKLIIGICNGFQILTNLGLVPAKENKYGERQAVLMHNAHARYECRWVKLKNTSQKCVWTRNIDTLHCPIAHGEGNFYAEKEVIDSLIKNDQIAFKYVKDDNSPANQEFPFNPNGAMLDIAGICDESGRIFGLMPHPERFNSFTNEDGWTLTKEKLLREGSPLPTLGKGLQVFKNAIEYFTK